MYLLASLEKTGFTSWRMYSNQRSSTNHAEGWNPPTSLTKTLWLLCPQGKRRITTCICWRSPWCPALMTAAGTIIVTLLLFHNTKFQSCALNNTKTIKGTCIPLQLPYSKWASLWVPPFTLFPSTQQFLNYWPFRDGYTEWHLNNLEHYMVAGSCVAIVFLTESQIRQSVYSMIDRFRVTGYFEKSAPNDPQMTLNTTKLKYQI